MTYHSLLRKVREENDNNNDTRLFFCTKELSNMTSTFSKVVGVKNISWVLFMYILCNWCAAMQHRSIAHGLNFLARNHAFGVVTPRPLKTSRLKYDKDEAIAFTRERWKEGGNKGGRRKGRGKDRAENKKKVEGRNWGKEGRRRAEKEEGWKKRKRMERGWEGKRREG